MDRDGAGRGRKNGKVPHDPIKESVPYMLQVAARVQTASFMSTLVGTNVHPAESYVVHELWKSSPLSQSDISERLGIGNAAIGKTLQRLEKGGFVERSRHATDGRRVMVRLTDKGVLAHERFDSAANALIDEIDTVLGSADAALLRTALAKIIDHFSARKPG